jgi:UDP-glucose 4-epimerase
MLHGEQPVLYGDGEQRRDFTHVDVVVDAMIKAVPVKGFDKFNVGTGVNYSLNEMVAEINKLLNTKIAPKYIKMPVKVYVMENLADTNHSKEVLGFEAKINLHDGLIKQIEYLRSIKSAAK